MGKNSASLRSALGKLALALLPVVVLYWWLERKRKRPLNDTPDRQAELERLQAENERLRRQLQAAAPQTLPAAAVELKPSAWGMISKGFLALLGAGLLILPPWLVVQERWLQNPWVRDSMRSAWCLSDTLCKTALPSYFLVVLPVFFGFLLLFWLAAPRFLEALHPPEIEDLPAPAIPGKTQRLVSSVLRLLALAGAGVLLWLGVRQGRIPGAELLLVLAVYAAGQWLTFRPFSARRTLLPGLPQWLFPAVFAQAALAFFLFSIYQKQNVFWLAAVLLGLAAVLLWRARRVMPLAVWVLLGSMLLNTYQIDSWRFSVIGDDYAFFGYARDILTKQNSADVLRNLFNGQAVYGTHPYISSLVQAVFLRIFGVNNFGWRFSNIYLLSLAAALFLLAFQRITARRAALLTGILLAGSSYLMSFGKIGYNNLQAYFLFALLLWLGARAVTRRQPLDYTWLGMAAGLCFYVYPAALYLLPLLVVFLLIYDFPKSRAALGRWVLFAAALFLMSIPVLVQPAYWQSKIAGTFIYAPGATGRTGLGFHVFTNSLYSLFTYLYLPNETHFVYSSHLDPLSAVFLPLGLAWCLATVRKQRFSRFLAAGFLLLLVLVGVSHDRWSPSNTRMFLLLPFLAAFAAFGLLWVWQALEKLPRTAAVAPLLIGVITTLILCLNFYQAYDIGRQRSLGTPSPEMLFLRFLEREETLSPGSERVYLFLTSPNWGIDGIKEMQRLYAKPASLLQLQRLVINSARLPAELINRLDDPNLILFLEPGMDYNWKLALDSELAGYGWVLCNLKDTPGSSPVAQVYFHPRSRFLCPQEGDWSIRP